MARINPRNASERSASLPCFYRCSTGLFTVLCIDNRRVGPEMNKQLRAKSLYEFNLTYENLAQSSIARRRKGFGPDPDHNPSISVARQVRVSQMHNLR